MPSPERRRPSVRIHDATPRNFCWNGCSPPSARHDPHGHASLQVRPFDPEAPYRRSPAWPRRAPSTTPTRRSSSARARAIVRRSRSCGSGTPHRVARWRARTARSTPTTSWPSRSPASTTRSSPGKGPTAAFRPYLFTTIRNTAASWGRARHETNLETLESFEDPDTSESATLDALDRSTTAQAFRSLPSRWQEVLWYSEVEGMSPQQVAPLRGHERQQHRRARVSRARGASPGVDPRAPEERHRTRLPVDHRPARHLHARQAARRATRAKLEAHLDECARCTIVAAEAREVGSRLALVLLPLAAGIGGATAYSGWLSQGAPVVEYAMGAAGVGAAAERGLRRRGGHGHGGRVRRLRSDICGRRRRRRFGGRRRNGSGHRGRRRSRGRGGGRRGGRHPARPDDFRPAGACAGGRVAVGLRAGRADHPAYAVAGRRCPTAASSPARSSPTPSRRPSCPHRHPMRSRSPPRPPHQHLHPHRRHQRAAAAR